MLGRHLPAEDVTERFVHNYPDSVILEAAYVFVRKMQLLYSLLYSSNLENLSDERYLYSYCVRCKQR